MARSSLKADSLKYLGMVCDRHANLNTAAGAALRPFTAGTSLSSYKNMTLHTGCTCTCGSFQCTQFLLVCVQARFGPLHSYDRAEKWTILFKMAGDSAQDDSNGQGHNPIMVHHAQVWSRACKVQLVPGGSAAVQCLSSTAKKILQADMQLSSRCDDCRSSHILSAMNSPTQSYLSKEWLLKCDPIDLSRFVVDLRERHLD